ncbi:MAG: hypothetical protein FWH10_03615 [Oscillospiraceae bacterium]|nr:hypothetical protein [Oscillospiraceae bacterium]
MPERSNNFSSHSHNNNFRDTVCIDCNKIMDSCRDKDCLEDLKVFLTDYSQEILDKATSIRCKDAEIIWTHVSVEPVPFNRGFYQIDIRFFFKLSFEACVCLGKSQEIEGIAVFDKNVILFGSEGNVNIFKSDPVSNSFCFLPNLNEAKHTNLPTAVVEIVDPICLGVKIIEKGNPCHCCCSVDSIPEHIHSHVRGQIIEEGEKELVCTLGIFAIIRLERPAQIVVPCSDFCIPEKECPPVNEDDPCKLFKKMKFPLNEFFPQSLGNIGGFSDNICDSELHGKPHYKK